MADRESTSERGGARPEALHAVRIEVAPGELIDKITILEIKRERIPDGPKRRNVLAELASLNGAARASLPVCERIEALARELKAVNLALWDIEDGIRECERGKDFGERFTALARSVYRMNDRRAAIKLAINLALGSSIVEEKSYADYD